MNTADGPMHEGLALSEESLLAELGWVRQLALSLVRDPAVADDVAQEAYLLARERPPREVETVAVRQVEIEGYSTVIGRWGGAVVGQAIGGTVGGRSARRVARAVGGVAGAVVGEAIEREATAETGLEITVRLANGDTIAVVQAADIAFVPGDQARILFGPEGSARVSRP